MRFYVAARAASGGSNSASTTGRLVDIRSRVATELEGLRGKTKDQLETSSSEHRCPGSIQVFRPRPVCRRCSSKQQQNKSSVSFHWAIYCGGSFRGNALRLKRRPVSFHLYRRRRDLAWLG